MCLTVYLASDITLPLIPWQREAPGLFISDRVVDTRNVKRHLTKPHIYVVGSDAHVATPSCT